MLACLPVFGQANSLPANPRYVFQQIGEEWGLSTRTVVSLVQDRDGFIWIGTLDGLLRFDGSSLTAFTEKEGLRSQPIHQVLLSPNGRIWVLTRTGIARFDGVRFEPFETGIEAELAAMPRPMPQRFAVDAAENVYVATASGLKRLSTTGPRSETVWSTAQGLQGSDVSAVHVAINGAVWFATQSEVAVLEPNAGKLRSYPASTIPLDGPVQAIATSSRNEVWLRTAQSVLLRAPGRESFEVEQRNLPQSSFAPAGLALDSAGDLLLPTFDGLYYRSHNTWHRVSVDQGLPANAVFTALEDREGALWLGLGGGGAVRWPGRHAWSAWTKAEGLPENVVWGMTRDLSGRLWVGTNDGIGIWSPTENKWLVLREANGLAGRAVTQLALDAEGWIWALSAGSGVARINPAQLEAHLVVLPAEAKTAPASIASAPDKTVWIGGDDYLLAAKVRQGEIAFDLKNLPPKALKCTRSIGFAPDGALWTGGSSCLCRIIGEDLQVFGEEHGIRGLTVDQVAARSANEAWFGNRSFHGVSQLKLAGGSAIVRHYSSSDGLPNDSVYLVGADNQGRVFVGGNAGLAVFETNGSMRALDRSDGLFWNDLSSIGFLAEQDGSVFFGTSRGLAHYNPKMDRAKPQPPNVKVTSAILGGKEALGAVAPSVGSESGDLDIKFAGLTFRKPEAVFFSYRLSGLDKDYTLTRSREVRYDSLPAGSYRFEVLCRSTTGIWSEAPATFAFSILPQWWETIWTRLAGVAALLVLIGFGVRLRTRRLEAERSRLETAVSVRSKELARVNSELASTVRELREQSFTDALTRTKNRRFFTTVIPDDISRVLRRFDEGSSSGAERNRDLLFFILDIDHFKKVNDTFGHMSGDRVLSEMGKRLTGIIRHSDMLVRWGGEEFLIVYRDANRQQAPLIAERILDAVGKEPFDLGDGFTLSRTCSVGWAAFPWLTRAPDAVFFEAVIELADRALYLAKASGRNQAVGVMPMYDESDESLYAEWLDRPLAEMEGKLVKLFRTKGPAQIQSTVPPTGSNSMPPTMPPSLPPNDPSFES